MKNKRSIKIIQCILYLVFNLVFIGAYAQTQHLVVTLSSDNNPSLQGELRWAIETALANLNSNQIFFIDFNIPESCPVIINLNNPLPVITPSVSDLTIDGSTQPCFGYGGLEPKIWINGSGITTNDSRGFQIDEAKRVTIKNLSIQNFSTGIFMELADDAKILNNVIFNTHATVIIAGDNKRNEFYGNIFGSDHSSRLHYTDENQSPEENFILTTSTHYPGPGVPQSNIIGGTAAGQANYFWNMSEQGKSLFIEHGVRNKISGNLFKNAVVVNGQGNINLETFNTANANKVSPTITKVQNNNGTLEVFGTAHDQGDVIEVFLTNEYTFYSNSLSSSNGSYLNLRTNRDIETYIGTVSATTGSGSLFSWVLRIPYIPIHALKGFTATASDFSTTNTDQNTSDFSNIMMMETEYPPCCPDQSIETIGGDTHLNFGNEIFICKGETLTFGMSEICKKFGEQNIPIEWNFGDASGRQTAFSTQHAYSQIGVFTVTAVIGPGDPDVCLETLYSRVVHVMECSLLNGCESCIGSFAPSPDSVYIVSAWVKEAGANRSTINYINPFIRIKSTTDPLVAYTQIEDFYPAGLIIDGWQRIEGRFELPNDAALIGIELVSENGDSYFDDIRVFPLNGNMKSYVYDPLTMQLVAELDENNYATFFEYDEEGKLIRTKKETEKGIMTIKENRNSSFKR